jgi:hypothetical protein
MEKVKVTEYGGIQGAMVDGTKDGKGIARIVTMDINAGQVFNREEVVKAAASDLKNATVPVMMTYTLFTQEKTYGWADNPNLGTGPGATGPTVKVVSEKEIAGVQQGIQSGQPTMSVKASAKVVSEKAVYGIQEAAEGSNSLPKP